MFDLATHPQPLPATGAALGLPFDWRLAAPTGLANYPATDFATPDAVPLVTGEMLATYALALEDGLQTAVILSLFTDSRADRDAVLPLNQTDRRGWVGDEFMGDAQGTRADVWGSALWLVYISKVTPDVLERARFAAQEALAWLVRDGIASRVQVVAQWAGPQSDRLAIRASIYKPDQLAPVYDVLWATSLRRLDALAAPVDAVACCDPPAPPAPPPPLPNFTSYIALSCFDNQVRPNFWINYQVSASDPLGIYTVRDVNGTLLNLDLVVTNPYQHSTPGFTHAFGTASSNLPAINALVLDYPSPWRLEYQAYIGAPVIVVSTSDVPVCALAPPPPAVGTLGWSQQVGAAAGPFASDNAGTVAGGNTQILYFQIIGGYVAGAVIEFGYSDLGYGTWSYGYDAEANLGYVDMRADNSGRLGAGYLQVKLFMNSFYTGGISCSVLVSDELYPDGSFLSFAPN